MADVEFPLRIEIPDGVLEEALDWIGDNGIPLETWNTYSFLY